MNQEQLLTHFQDMILPYEKRIVGQHFLRQESLIEELIKLTKNEFFSFVSDYPEAGQEWHLLERIFFSQLLGIVEDRTYSSLKPKLLQFSYATIDSIIKLRG
ncbi:hypothetical protein [Streptococcus cuniculi]|uniref:Uncharacterized protein n=1 Tax=Streptococcus cuniculi TaxID=1432788 RepID=A0A4Y9JE86_9STRE|nr:hypothetical protein [Streptococcus cuniculi]MBF0777857.1 hypothetical protein [Streptococcus cuniculi]TFU98155.1 hypothetical protein E4T82_03860 [Streptococcus cuniculi]